MSSSERSTKERGNEGQGLGLSAGVHTVFLLERVDLGMSMLLWPGKMFKQAKMLFPCYRIFSLFNDVFEALNLLLIIVYTFVAEIQLPGHAIGLLFITQSSG
jgi:hypothetical protein